jgi:hypothetical protein
VLTRYAVLGLVAVSIVIASGCGGGGGTVATGAVEGYVFASTSRSLDVGRQATPPPGFEGVNGATVAIGSRQTTTRNDSRGEPGYFFLDAVPVGAQTLTVTLTGSDPVSKQVTITAGQTAQVGDVLVGGKYWTFMVYLDADNDLEHYGILNMNQMEEVGSDSDINIVVQMDRHESYDDSNGDWHTTRRYYVTQDQDSAVINSTLIEDLGELDMADPENLHDFVEWAMENYPASHYCLVIWNHGSGWVPKGGFDATRAVVYDDTSGSIMSMPELRLALTGFDLDMVAFDACYMGMLEVAYEIAQSCDYVVASEESPPGAGYPYDQFLSVLAATPSMDAETFGRQIVDDYVEAYYSVTESLISTANLEPLAGAVGSLAQALLSDFPSHQAAYETARDTCQAFSGASYYKDLYDFCTVLREASDSSAVDTAAQAVRAAVTDAVLHEAHGGSSLADSHGVSIYIPGRSGEYFLGYTDLRFTQNHPNWWSLIRP